MPGNPFKKIKGIIRKKDARKKSQDATTPENSLDIQDEIPASDTLLRPKKTEKTKKSEKPENTKKSEKKHEKTKSQKSLHETEPFDMRSLTSSHSQQSIANETDYIKYGEKHRHSYPEGSQTTHSKHYASRNTLNVPSAIYRHSVSDDGRSIRSSGRSSRHRSECESDTKSIKSGKSRVSSHKSSTASLKSLTSVKSWKSWISGSSSKHNRVSSFVSSVDMERAEGEELAKIENAR